MNGGVSYVQSYLPLEKVRELYGVSKAMIYKLKRDKKLRLFHLGTKPFIRPQDLESLMIEAVAEDSQNDKELVSVKE